MDPTPTTRRSDTEEVGDLHVLFSSASHLFAISHEVVEQMVTLPEVVSVPGAHPAVRGVINLRGVVLGLVDLRLALGQRSGADEREALLAELERHHREHDAWLDALEHAAATGGAFARETDAGACPFGRFLAEQSESRRHESRFFNHFGRAHQELHAGAADVLAAIARDDLEVARHHAGRLRRTTGSRLGAMFVDVAGMMRTARRDIALVLRHPGRAPLAVQVDAVETVDRLAAAEGPDLDGLARGGFISSIAKDSEGRLVTVLAPERLFALVAA